jgi:hypothetical protein
MIDSAPWTPLDFPPLLMVGRGGEPPDWTGVGVGGASRNRLCRGSRVVEPRYPFAGEERRSAPATGRHAAMWSGAAAILVLATLLSSGARAQSSAPDASTTPGAINPAVTQKTIGETICARGWTRMVRPPVQYTEELKRRQIRTFGYDDRRLSQYEEDHLIPLGLGGAPSDPRNLWPELRTSPDGWGADRKDELEFALNQLVCAGRLPLREAQRAIATDWIAAYRRYVGLPR